MSAFLALGLVDPVFGSQAIFRKILAAMSRPGSIHTLPPDLNGSPDGLSPAAAAILLTMCDYETPFFSSDDTNVTSDWLRFYTGAIRTSHPADAKFALIRSDVENPKLQDFNLGDDRYPDLSTTLVIECPHMTGGSPVALSGPGIQGKLDIAPSGLRQGFWTEVQNNSLRYPLGVDLIFTNGLDLMALPRSIRIVEHV